MINVYKSPIDSETDQTTLQIHSNNFTLTTNSKFINPISLQPDLLDFLYFTL